MADVVNLVNVEVLMLSRWVKRKFVPYVDDGANHESSQMSEQLLVLI